MKLLIPIFLLIVLSGHAQNNQSINSRIEVEVMKSSIENLKILISDIKQHNSELLDAKKSEVEKLMQQKTDALDTRMLIYVSIFVAAFILVFGFFRWLGKSEIRRIVNELSIKQIDEQLKTKLSNEVIDTKLSSLGKPIIKQMLNDISASQEKAKMSIDALEESSKKYKELLIELTSRTTEVDASKATPEEKATEKEFNDIVDKIKHENEFTPRDWYLRGKEAYDKNDDENALIYLSNSIKFTANSADAIDALFYRGLIYYRNNRLKEALSDFDETEKHDKNMYIYFIRSNTFMRLKEFSKALSDVEIAITLAPDDKDVINLHEKILKAMKNE